MARQQPELWRGLVNPILAGPVFPITVALEIPDNTNTDYPIFVATRNVAIRRASVAVETSPDGTSIFALVNATDSEDLTSADLDADALTASTAGSFSMGDNADLIEEGDVVALEWESTGTTAPGTVVVCLEVEFLELK